MLQFPTWKVLLIVGITIIGVLLALPNVLTEKQRESLPGFLPSSPVNLGLDLQGGVYLLLEVDHQRSLIKQLEDLRRDAQSKLNAMRGADRIYYSDMRVNPAGVDIRLADQSMVDLAATALNPLTINSEGMSNGVRLSRPGDGRIFLVFTESRINDIKRDPSSSFSMALTRLENAARTILEAEAATGTLRINSITLSEPTLSFKPRDASRMEDALKIARGLNSEAGGQLGANALNVRRGSGQDVIISFSAQEAEKIKRDAVRQTVAKLGPRLDPDGLAEMTIQPQGENRIIIEAPGEENPLRLKQLIQQPGELTLNLVDDSQDNLQQALNTGLTKDGYQLVPTSEGGFLLIEEDPIITGDMVKNASQGFDKNNQPAVNFTLNTRGGAIFGRESGANIGRRFAIILDGESKSAPVIRGAITGGSGIIEGRFTMDEANDLATVIQAGALPADVVVVEEREVGASLGEDSIRAGATASMIGLLLVAIFIIIAYGLFGGFAVGSLFINIVLILGVLSGLGATLTLPGIAGIILTIGMAVDANVLVFERIREEYRNGRSPMTAVDAGYQQAMSTIFDANITTLLAASVLYMLGSGAVKGFAVTLAIGIFTSVFTAFVITRWFTVLWLRGARPKSLPI